MDKYYLDFTGVKKYGDLHGELKRGLEFPDFYGENLDALWDCLTGFMDAPANIYVKGVEQLPEDLKSEWNDVLRIFNRAKEWYAKYNEDFVLIFEDER